MKRLIALLLLVFLLAPLPSSAGGTNSMFARMEFWVDEMEKDGAMSQAEAKKKRNEIETLKKKVDAEFAKTPGGFSRQANPELFRELDDLAKPLLDRYQEMRGYR